MVEAIDLLRFHKKMTSQPICEPHLMALGVENWRSDQLVAARHAGRFLYHLSPSFSAVMVPQDSASSTGAMLLWMYIYLEKQLLVVRRSK